VFVGDVAKFRAYLRNRSRTAKRKSFLGRREDFLRQKAIIAGLVDGVSTMERLIGTYGTDRKMAVRMACRRSDPKNHAIK